MSTDTMESPVINDPTLAYDSDARLAATIDALPLGAQERLETYRVQMANVGAQRYANEALLRVETERRDGIKNQIASIEGNDAASNKSREVLYGRLDKANAKLASLKAKTKVASKAPNVEEIEEKLRDVKLWSRVTESNSDRTRPGARTLVVFSPPRFVDARPDVSRKKNQSEKEALDESVAKLAALRSERTQVGKAALSLTEAEAKLESDIRTMAAKGAPDLEGVTRMTRGKQGNIKWPGEPFFGGPWDAEKAIAFQLWCDVDSVIERCKTELRNRYQGKFALPSSDRATRGADLDKQIAHQERVVEARAERCDSVGVEYSRCWVSSVFAKLGIDIAEQAESIERDDVEDFG